jgi:hypothetical protein
MSNTDINAISDATAVTNTITKKKFVPNKEYFGYYPMYYQYELSMYKVSKSDSNKDIYCFSIDANCNSVYKLEVISDKPLNVSTFKLFYIDNSNNVIQSTDLDYVTSLNAINHHVTYEITNYTKDHQIVLCRKGVKVFLEMSIDDQVSIDSITLGLRSCSWLPGNSYPIEISPQDTYDFTENIYINHE